MNIPAILNAKYPGTQWALVSDTYDGLEWLDESPKPTEAELEALWPEVEYESAYAEVDEQRRQAYSREADPLFFKSQRGKSTKQEWLDKIAEIDARFPYPEPPKGKK